LDSLFDEYH
jgi:hypothetical protein